MTGSDLARSSLMAAVLNSLVAIVLRVLTFVSNAFILRYVSKEALGIINVRLLLFSDTVLFISREAVRKACLGRPAQGDWKGTINLIWLSCPISILSSLILGYVWKFLLEMPSSHSETEQYRTAIDLMSLGAIIEIFCEPFFIVGQVNKFVKFRSVVDFLHLGIRTFLMVAVVFAYPSMSILLFGYSHLMATCVLLFINISYFGYLIYKKPSVHSLTSNAKTLNRKTSMEKVLNEKTSNEKPSNFKESSSISTYFRSLNQFLPSSPLNTDQTQFHLAKAFFKQGIVKQLLTEGEKYMFTGLSLMTLAQQGIYDVVGNLGSLAARLVFSKIEESAYFYFTQTVSREKDVKNRDKELEATRHLTQLLRWMTTLGLVICAFGFSYSRLLLFIYGGSTLSEGLGTQLLRGHCVFVLFMSVNGVSECFSFAVMSRSEVDAYNYVLGLLSIAFLILAWASSKVLGPVGFIVANCCNFTFRICHNFYVIEKRNRELKTDLPSPILGLIPTRKTLVAILVSGVLCQVSEILIFSAENFQTVLVHLAIGGLCFLVTILVVLLDEPHLKNFVSRIIFKRKAE